MKTVENILKHFLGHHLPRWSVNHLKTEVLGLFLLHHAGLDGDPPPGVAVRTLRVIGAHGKVVELLQQFLIQSGLWGTNGIHELR